MPAYVIADIAIRDQEAAAQYRSIAQETVAQYGGRYVVRTDDVEVVEGEWPQGQRIVVLEFPSLERAREWYASPEYATALEVGAEAMDRRMILADGVE